MPHKDEKFRVNQNIFLRPMFFSSFLDIEMVGSHDLFGDP